MTTTYAETQFYLSDTHVKTVVHNRPDGKPSVQLNATEAVLKYRQSEIDEVRFVPKDAGLTAKNHAVKIDIDLASGRHIDEDREFDIPDPTGDDATDEFSYGNGGVVGWKLKVVTKKKIAVLIDGPPSP